MKIRQWIPGIALLLLIVAAILGWRGTRYLGQTPPPVASKRGKKVVAPPPKERRVDERPLITANRMVALAATPEEQPFAVQAQRLANHEVDLAFADAIREAALNPPPPTPERKALADLKDKAEKAVAADQARIKQLSRALEVAKDNDALEDQLDMAKAQLELDTDELEEAASDLEQAGGDPQARIRRLKAAHEAAQAEAQAPKATQVEFQGGSLIASFRQWKRLRNQTRQLGEARQEAVDKCQRMTKRHAEFADLLAKSKDERAAVKQKAVGLAKATDGDREATKATVGSLKQFIEQQRTLSDMGRRIQDEQGLVEVYENWGLLLEVRERAALHKLLAELLGVLAVLMGVFLVDRIIEHLIKGVGPELLRATTLSSLAKFGVRLVGVLIIVFMCFGVPSQLTTILGLAGAGLTVALKDFIVAFFGWFVLMGRNGIRVGDWVEIKGVGGEVVEIGLMHTVLLETGSWTDSGHPTGRRVSFVNSFAVEGHYFNFTTAGQWMWDELSVLVPAGQDPYPIIDGIQKRVEQETREGAKLAEQEWQQAASRYRVQSFSAVPGINVVPTSQGTEVRVRYITRAHERHETRRNLYNSVLELMHGKRE